MSNIVGEELASLIPQTSKSWFTQPHLRSLNLRLLVPLLASGTMGFDGSMMNGLLSLSTWNDYFGKPSASILGLMNAVLALGVVLSAFPTGWFSDRFGRKKALMTGSVILIAAAALQTASQNVATFIVARFFIGVGIEVSVLSSPVLITELAYPTHRGKVTNLYNTFFYFGSIVSSWVIFGTFNMSATSTWTWRIPSLLQALFPLCQLCGIAFLPESPRWLIANGRVDEARAIFVKYHAAGDEHSPLVDYEMEEINGHVQSELEAEGIGWSALWATEADKKRLAVIILVAIIAQWAGNGIISYYLSLVLDSVGITGSFDQTLINGILQIFNAFAAVFGVTLVDKMGRRSLWLWSVTGMLLSYVAWTASSAVNANTGSKGAGYAVIVFLFIFFFHYDIAVTPFTFGYPTEILPYHTRQKGLSVVGFTTGLALLFNSFVNPIALEAIGWKYYFVYIAILAIFLVIVYFFFPETRGMSLEQISEVFEDHRTVRGQRHATPIVLAEKGVLDVEHVEKM